MRCPRLPYCSVATRPPTATSLMRATTRRLENAIARARDINVSQVGYHEVTTCPPAALVLVFGDRGPRASCRTRRTTDSIPSREYRPALRCSPRTSSDRGPFRYPGMIRRLAFSDGRHRRTGSLPRALYRYRLVAVPTKDSCCRPPAPTTSWHSCPRNNPANSGWLWALAEQFYAQGHLLFAGRNLTGSGHSMRVFPFGGNPLLGVSRSRGSVDSAGIRRVICSEVRIRRIGYA